MNILSSTRASLCRRCRDVSASLAVLGKSHIRDMFEVVSDKYLITTSFVRLFVLFDLTGNISK